MCGRAAVIRGAAGLARVAGARRVIHDARSRRAAAGPAPAGGAAGGGGGGGAGFFRDGGRVGGGGGDRPVDAVMVDEHRHAAVPVVHDRFHVEKPTITGDTTAAPTTTTTTTSTESHFEYLPQKTAAPMPDTTTTTPTTTEWIEPTKEKSSMQTEMKSPKKIAEKSAPTKPVYRDYNVGPTSSMPVWRIQTVEEQRELLALDKSLPDSTVKHEVEELLGDGEGLTAETLQPVPVIQYMTFGFPNPQAGRKGPDGSIASALVFNARSETIDEKTMWKGLVNKKRCVVLVDGSESEFYEFHTEYSNQTGDATRKQPYFFHMPLADKKTPVIDIKKDESPFPVMHLAAVYDASIDDATGETQYSFCILTCGPSKEMRQVHNRMPVILSPEDAKKWVDGEHYSFDQVKHVLVPYEGLGFYKVPSVVNNSRNHGVECIEPLEQFEKRQKASGISRFFSPVAKTSTKSSPPPATPSTTTQSSHGSYTSTMAASVTDDDVDTFFNTQGAPGKIFPTRINPADTGLIDPRPATSEPSTVTSNAADLAESFVQQVKDEELKSHHTSSEHSHPDVTMKESISNKRKHESGEDQSIKSEEASSTTTVEPSSKRHKLTASERAHQQ